MCLIVYSNDHAPLTVRLIYSSSKLRTVQMMIFSLVAMIGLAKCCITSACLQWLCHSGERIVARGPLVYVKYFVFFFSIQYAKTKTIIDSTSLKKKKQKKKKKTHIYIRISESVLFNVLADILGRVFPARNQY